MIPKANRNALVADWLADVQKSIIESLPQILELRQTRKIKSDTSYVTAGDYLAQEITIKKISKFLPDCTVISEELENSIISPDGGYVVVIDPIDGTENFTSGLPEWGISLSCYFDFNHVASMIGCPEMNQWISTGNVLSRYHGSRIRALSSSLTKNDLKNVSSGHEYRVFGCCVYNMIQVIKGAVSSFENPKGANAWDILGGVNLALEQGLRVTIDNKEYAGEYLTPDKKYCFKISNR
jgi:myo-inositol-1(or 4)-monophosphatase